MGKRISARLLHLVSELPDGEAIIGWKRIAQVMCMSPSAAQRLARSDDTFPKRTTPGGSVYVRVEEFMEWWNTCSVKHERGF